MKKIICILTILMLTSVIIAINNVYAATDGVDEIIDAMSGANDGSAVAAQSSGIGDAINNVIGLIQVAGVGISVVVISILGIKYILASPGEKADVKKSAMPIVIGCVLLFGAVGIMTAVEEFSKVLSS